MALPRIAVTMGDPAGIGPEVCLRLLADRSVQECATPIVFGDAAVLARVAEHCGLVAPKRVFSLADWQAMRYEITDAAVLDCAAIAADCVRPGQVDAATGAAAYAYIERALDAAVAGEVEAVTTGPVHKEALNAAGVPFPGHTEIFTVKMGARRACMMLTAEQITCSFVTAHVGFKDVPGLLSEARILDVIELSHEVMVRLRGGAPRLVVCGLNPHAGEHGLFGDREEQRHIAPAVEAARAEGMDIDGPLPPDTAFLPQRRRETDCYVCMYHDQGLIPLKALAFDKAVNVTLGLPVIRTSVDHGTALDIAWQGKADATSLLEAVRLAARLATPAD